MLCESGGQCLPPTDPLDADSADSKIPVKRVVRSQIEIHDADKHLLATLGAVQMDSLTGVALERHTTRLTKLRAKINLFLQKCALAANVAAAKKARVNYEAEDVMMWCHARLIQEHQFRDKQIKFRNY
jgi:hypothetical protein